ncbi:MAG: hypothetical protein IPM83_10630 [Ignavibacteria bacterium]|nr:hypothetical protein [Ignavibacteria bacterium]
MRPLQLGLHIIDQVGFAELVLKGLTITSRVNRVVVHPGCGVEKLRSTETFMNVVRSCAQEVVVPPSAGCCGMGGDRGLMYPELVESALRSEKNEIPTGVDLGVSCNVLCEGALTRRTGIPYMSLLHLVRAGNTSLTEHLVLPHDALAQRHEREVGARAVTRQRSTVQRQEDLPTSQPSHRRGDQQPVTHDAKKQEAPAHNHS